MNGMHPVVINGVLCLCVWLMHVFFWGDKLVDFEAMTTPSPDGFSKTAKSWMNLKRCADYCVLFH